jgi:hypothetical protein
VTTWPLVGGLRLYPSSRSGMASRTTPRRNTAMTDPKSDAKNGVKTLGIRLSDDLHAQFSLAAQLDGLSLTDAIRKAVELYVEAKRSEGDFAQRANAALAEIEREANSRRAAIEALLGTTEETDGGSASTPRKTRS